MNGILQFSDIAGPIPLHHGLNGVVGHDRQGIGIAQRLKEMLDEQGDIFPTGPQRRQMDGDNVDAIEEIIPQGALAHLFGKVAVGGCHNANIGNNGLIAPDRGVAAAFDGAQQFDLQIGIDLADFVQKERAAVSLARKPGLSLWAPVKPLFYDRRTRFPADFRVWRRSLPAQMPVAAVA